MKAKIDTYNIKQYENQRIVSVIELLEPIGKKKFVLCWVEYLNANCLVKVSDIKFVE